MNSTLAAKPPFAGLYDFVKMHLVVVNGIVLASGTIVGALDFLAPRLSFIPAVVYSVTALLALSMLAVALAPGLIARALGALGLATKSEAGPLWRRPAWQFGTALLIGISTLGFASVARASEGGLIASRFPTAREWQATILGLRQDVASLKSGVDSANMKLDRIVAVVDPANPADRCPDIACAIEGGASAGAVKALFDRGARIEGGPVINANLSHEIATSTRPDRLDTLNLLLAHGLDMEARFYPFESDPNMVNQAAASVARQIVNMSGMVDGVRESLTNAKRYPALSDWNRTMSCIVRSSGGPTLIQLAALRGDEELYRHLEAHGVAWPREPLICEWQWLGRSGGVRVLIDHGVARVTPIPS